MDTQKDWVDFKAVKQAVSMEMVLDRYGINWLRKNRDELRGRCPIHKGEGERSFQVNISKGAFQCFSCKARGNVLDFVAAMEQCSIRDAALKLNAWFLVGDSAEIAGTPAQVEKQESESIPAGPINPALSFELRVDHAHEYGQSRGLSVETLQFFGAGLCVSKGMFAGRFIIPLHNAAGELVGYAGRSLDDWSQSISSLPATKAFTSRTCCLISIESLRAQSRSSSSRASLPVCTSGRWASARLGCLGRLCQKNRRQC